MFYSKQEYKTLWRKRSFSETVAACLFAGRCYFRTGLRCCYPASAGMQCAQI